MVKLIDRPDPRVPIMATFIVLALTFLIAAIYSTAFLCDEFVKNPNICQNIQNINAISPYILMLFFFFLFGIYFIYALGLYKHISSPAMRRLRRKQARRAKFE